jgi:hypothetical protein
MIFLYGIIIVIEHSLFVKWLLQFYFDLKQPVTY